MDFALISDNKESYLILNGHKTVKFQTKSVEKFNKCIKYFSDLGFKQTDELYSIEYGCHHWHYRTAESLDQDEFIEMLIKNKFTKDE